MHIGLARVAALAMLLAGASALAHFQVILPSDDIVSDDDSRTLDLSILFTHPMENGPVMPMAPPKQFGVLFQGKKVDLLSSLKEKPIDNKMAYSCAYPVKAPTDYIFYIEPAPYWEPAEEKMIVHYTKVIVDAMGAEEGWDAAVGFPVEIEPLVRPYGLWTGNVFSGLVKKNGQSLPFADIEVEYMNEGGKVAIPSDPYSTQVIKADANGVFTYAMPKAGWWGFAALTDSEKKMPNPDGKEVDVELGGLIWVKTVDMK